MDAIWYGIGSFMEWIFRLIEPVGMVVDYLFVFVIAAGAIFWLWYDMQERKGGRNFMADKGGKD